MALGERVKQLRFEKGWGTEELATRAGISRGALYAIEAGDTARPRASTVRGLAVALGLTVAGLVAEGPPAPPFDSEADFRAIVKEANASPPRGPAAA